MAVGQYRYNPDLDRGKLEQAILFFLHHASNIHLGRTKLMKLLYYADFDHFEQFGEPITGARYYKLPHGPVPTEADAIIGEMERDGRIVCGSVDRGEYVQHRCEAAEEVDVSAFSETERDVLALVANRWFAATAKEISDASHDEAPWLGVKPAELIPYYLAHYRNRFGEMDLDEDELLDDDTFEAQESRAVVG